LRLEFFTIEFQVVCGNIRGSTGQFQFNEVWLGDVAVCHVNVLRTKRDSPQYFSIDIDALRAIELSRREKISVEIVAT
jgi:hypothetical protein